MGKVMARTRPRARASTALKKEGQVSSAVLLDVVLCRVLQVRWSAESNQGRHHKDSLAKGWVGLQ